MYDLLLFGLLVAVVVVLWIWGGALPNGIAELIATLTGVLVGIRAEHVISILRERREAAQARWLLRDELVANLAVVVDIANQEKDFPAVVESVFSLRSGLWSALSAGGRLNVIGRPGLLQALNWAYATLEDLRIIARLFFQGSKWVTLEDAPGLKPEFDKLRKARAAEAVAAMNAALTLLAAEVA